MYFKNVIRVFVIDKKKIFNQKIVLKLIQKCI